MKRTIRKTLALSSLIFVAADSGMASAQYYGGFNFSLSRYGAVADAADDRGFFIASTALDDRRVRYGLKLGYQVAPYLAVVSRYSEFDRRGTASPLARSYGLDLDSRLPLSARFSISGSAGVARLRNDTTLGAGFYSDPLASSGARAHTAGRLGLGMQYRFSNSLGLRFDFERYRALTGASMGDLDADLMSLGVMLKF